MFFFCFWDGVICCSVRSRLDGNGYCDDGLCRLSLDVVMIDGIDV